MQSFAVTSIMAEQKKSVINAETGEAESRSDLRAISTDSFDFSMILDNRVSIFIVSAPSISISAGGTWTKLISRQADAMCSEKLAMR